MNLFALSCFCTAVLTAILGLFVFLENHKNRLNQFWFFTTIAIFIWTIGLGRVVMSDNAESALFWQRILYIGTILIPIFYLHFCITFLKRKVPRDKWILTIGYALSCFFIFLAFTKLFIVKVDPRNSFNYWPIETGSLYWLFLVYFSFYVIYAVGSLWANRKDQNGVTNSQVNYVYYAALIGFAGSSTNFLLDFNLNVYPFGNYLVAFYVVFMTYAIVKYHLFNIKVIATELLTFTIWAVLAIQLFLSQSKQQFIINSVLLIFVVFLGIFLIRSVLKEVEQKEKLKILTAELEKANEQLKVLDQARAEFISIASHQLRTPPATVKWFLSTVIGGDYGKVPPEIKEILEKTERTNNSLISLIDDMLNVSRIERGKMEFLFEPAHVEDLVKITFEQLQPMAQEKNLQLIWKNPNIKLPQIMADKEKLRQVVNNIIDNAIKYTKEGKIEISLAKEGENIKFVSEDTGKGVEKDKIDNLFAKYTRGKESIKQSTGLGLGLYVAKIIVEHHEGKIWAESEGLGKGSKFIFSLPIHTDLKATEFDFKTDQKPEMAKV
jgi:signal transduction histidine kinase